MQQKMIETGYVPRRLQAQLHGQLKRFNILVMHRRWGKTMFSINEMLDQGLRLYTSKKRKMPRYAYIAPTYGQAKKISWDYWKAACANIPGTSINEQELRIDISLLGDPANTLRFQLLGADNPDSLRGIYLDGVILDEPAQMRPSLWTEVVRPLLSDREGWAIFIGTPKGRNTFYEAYERAKKDPDWFTAIYKASETGIIPKSELDAMFREMGEEAYNQEFEVSFDAAIKGAYYAKLVNDLENRPKSQITSVPHDPALGTITAWDLGIGDSLVVWFAQRHFREVRIIDYLEMSGMEEGLGNVVRELNRKPYTYTTHILPHDAAVRDLGSGKTRIETLRTLGLKGLEVLPRTKVDDGINAVRNLLPMCWFDAVNCHRGIECLREYRREWDDKLSIFKTKPLHNEYSHAADGFRYLALGIDKERPLIEPKRQTHSDMDYNEFGERY